MSNENESWIPIALLLLILAIISPITVMWVSMVPQGDLYEILMPFGGIQIDTRYGGSIYPNYSPPIMMAALVYLALRLGVSAVAIASLSRRLPDIALLLAGIVEIIMVVVLPLLLSIGGGMYIPVPILGVVIILVYLLRIRR